MRYVLDYLPVLDKAGPGTYLDVRPEAQRRHNEAGQRKLGTTAWAAGCRSWYQTAAGKNTTLLPALTPAFRRSVKRGRLPDYGLAKAPAPVRQPA